MRALAFWKIAALHFDFDVPEYIAVPLALQNEIGRVGAEEVFEVVESCVTESLVAEQLASVRFICALCILAVDQGYISLLLVASMRPVYRSHGNSTDSGIDFIDGETKSELFQVEWLVDVVNGLSCEELGR